jgi:tRNA G18 (ribose-2'-O)-methylase SpoU
VKTFGIETLDDPRLAAYRDLKRSNLTRWSPGFIVEGEKVVRRLLVSDFPVESLLLGRRFVPAFAGQVPADVPVYVLPDKLVEALVGFNFHRGVVARGIRRPPVDWRLALGRRPRETVVVLPEVHDPDNLGSILRTARALGVDAIMVGPRCADAFSRRVVRVSMGAGFFLPIIELADVPCALRRLRDEFAYELLATVPPGSAADDVVAPGVTTSRESAELSERQAVLFGSEGHGLDAECLALCQRTISIAIDPNADSLNVAVAAGIVLHDLLRDQYGPRTPVADAAPMLGGLGYER